MSTEPSKFDRLPKTLKGVREFNAGKGILLFLIGALLYVGHTAFIPVALAFLAGLILSSPVEALFRLGLPRGIGAVLILIVALAAVAGLVALVWTPSQQWYASAPHTLSVIQRKFTPVARLMNHIEQLTDRAGKVGAPNAAEPAAVAVPQESTSRILLSTARDAAIGLATFVIITLFLLAGGPPMVARMTAAFFDHLKAHHVQGYIEKVRGEVGHFYLITTFINLGLGIATTLVMMAWGMPTPYLWGAVAASLNFIPYAGATTTLIVVTLVAIVSFDGLGHAAGVALSYLGLAVIEGQIVQPLLVGRRLDVNPLLIFLGLWFGGIFWGISGVILATPILVALKVIAENAIHGESMMQFLGPNDPSPARFDKLRKAAKGS
ncbi:MAG TPA: AI-2E family transporter [Steroidobacteraceae bacterium]|jgi:predicted PurR-regulated permease PerM|nr:AI-2E family transporter [Steroidobacteraceae bacterium]